MLHCWYSWCPPSDPENGRNKRAREMIALVELIIKKREKERRDPELVRRIVAEVQSKP